MEKMTHYKILGRDKYYNAVIRLKNDEMVMETGSKYRKNSFINHSLMDLSYAIFSLIGETPEICVNPLSGGMLDFGGIEKNVSKEEALISGFGLKVPIYVNDVNCSSKERFSGRKLSGFEEIKKHPYEPEIADSVNRGLYKKWLKVEQKKILDETPALIGVKIPEKEMTVTIQFQNLPALEFLKEVSESYGIYPEVAYLYLKRKKICEPGVMKLDENITRAILELKKGSESILIETCPILALDYCSGNTMEIYGRLA
ncbi:MAG: hypothetical protein JSV92_05125 [archaeon]|nr:MAG: hypothetical protein JSV92_05125 [archaeon]